MSGLIEPRTLKGFRDYLPELMIPRERLLETARRVYRSFGFAPIDTPALEYAEILLGKGGDESDRLIYRFQDHGDRDVALRFDLTVPFARFAAQNIGKLGTPFRRYAMGPVWRGENTAHGRYREFWQCDFDTIGTTSNASDTETAIVICELMRALGFERFEVRVNNRLLLNGLLEQFGAGDRAVPVLRALDKLLKIGREKVAAEMVQTGGISPTQADSILDLAALRGANGAILDRLRADYASNAKAADGIARLSQLLDVARAAGIPEENLRLDLSIARGLDYYTGTIYETFLLDKPDIGSVCSGGRYDNLAGLYTKQALPGVGASLGVDRLLAAMEELGLIGGVSTPAPVLVVLFAEEHLAGYARVAQILRRAGINTEVYPEAKKMGAQLKYAESRGVKVALIAGPDEFAQGVWKVKDLARRQETTAPETGIVEAVRAVLG